MKITSNTIGNYSPNYTGNIKPAAKQAETLNAAPTDKINEEEKMFFLNMYPENKSEIVDYYFYKRSGKMAGVTVGSLFDRRG